MLVKIIRDTRAAPDHVKVQLFEKGQELELPEWLALALCSDGSAEHTGATHDSAESKGSTEAPDFTEAPYLGRVFAEHIVSEMNISTWDELQHACSLRKEELVALRGITEGRVEEIGAWIEDNK